jgi:hypothetical protein
VPAVETVVPPASDAGDGAARRGRDSGRLAPAGGRARESGRLAAGAAGRDGRDGGGRGNNNSGSRGRESGRVGGGSGRLAAVRRSPRFGETARRRGFITEEQLQTALDLQKARDRRGESHKLLGIILLEMGAIDNAQLIDALREMSSQGR